jgi:hypothetical protein
MRTGGTATDVSGREELSGVTETDVAGRALVDCVGFRVESGGSTIGTVADVRHGPSTRWDHPAALAIRAGRASDRALIVTVDQVADVLPDEGLVVLRDPFVVSASETAAPVLSLGAVEAHVRRPRSGRRRLR